MKTFEEQQAELLNNFQRQMKNICDDVISSFYTDITPFAETDATINFTNKLRDEIYNEIVKEIASEYSYHSWAHSIRMALLRDHKEELQNKIIEDLQEKLKQKDDTINQLYNRRY